MDGKWESLIQDLELPSIISGLVARLTAPTGLQGGEQNTNPGSKLEASDRWTLSSGRAVEGTFPGLLKPGASGSEQGQAVLAAHAHCSCPASASTPTPGSKISKKIVLGKMNSLYSQHEQENYIPASSTNGKNKSLIYSNFVEL